MKSRRVLKKRQRNEEFSTLVPLLRPLSHCPSSEDRQVAIVLYGWNGFSVHAAVYIFDKSMPACVCQSEDRHFLVLL